MLKRIKNTDFQLRSEEVKEILTRPPVWIVKWGIIIVFMFLMIIITLSFIIRYPDVINAKVLITTRQPTEKIVSKFTGQLSKILIENRDTVVIGQKLAMIKNSADFKDVYVLKRIIDSLQIKENEFNFPVEKTLYLSLGEISSSYYNFEKAYNMYCIFTDSIKKNKLSKNAILVKKSELLRTYSLLKEEIFNWENKYVLISSTTGIISFEDYWEVNQLIHSERQLFSILPINSLLIGKITLPANHAGKIQKGQEVLVKLDNLPNLQFNILKGSIDNFFISPNSDGNYNILISFLNGVKTPKNENYNIDQELIADAKIITEDLSIANRLFFKFNNLFN